MTMTIPPFLSELFLPFLISMDLHDIDMHVAKFIDQIPKGRINNASAFQSASFHKLVMSPLF